MSKINSKLTMKNADDYQRNPLGIENVAFEKASELNIELSPKEIIVNQLNSMKNSDMDFDDFLPLIGEFGYYQILLFFMMIPFAFSMAFVYFTQFFITLVPESHWCAVPELANFSVDKRIELSIPLLETGRSKCKMYAVNYTEIILNNIPVDSMWPTKDCSHGWEYNHSEISYPTISTELNWVCDNATLPTIAQAIFFLGAVFGGLIFGWIADRYGRVPSLIACNLMGFIFGVATGFTKSFWSFTLCRFMLGFSFDNCFMMMYILVLEYVGPKWRTFVANMSIAVFFTFAATILPYIAIWISNWQILAIVTSIPLIFAVFTPWLIPESARWLVSQGKIPKAMKILRKFERINGKNINPNIYDQFENSCTKKIESIEINNSIMDLFKTPRLRKITILLIIIWMLISIVFDGHIRNVGGLGLNVFMTFSIACATEFPADIILILTLDRFGRRWMAFGTMVLSGVFSLIATLFPIGIHFAILALLGRFCVNFSYNIGVQYAAELLPTVVRGQGVTFIHIMGYVASIISPFIVYLGSVSPILPLLLLGLFGIIGGILALFLPETLNHELPQTILDGENFGKEQSMWDFPFCMEKRKN